MKVKAVNLHPQPGTTELRTFLFDPVTGRELPVEGGDVPESSFWVRRLLAREIVRTDQSPTGLEPVTPLITR